jgi:hypothetical protein
MKLVEGAMKMPSETGRGGDPATVALRGATLAVAFVMLTACWHWPVQEKRTGMSPGAKVAIIGGAAGGGAAGAVVATRKDRDK